MASLLARLAKRRQARKRAQVVDDGLDAPPDEIEKEDEEIPLIEVLEHFRVEKFISPLEDMGVEGLDDLSYLQDSDLEKLGMPIIWRRKLMEALGSDWRAPQEHAADAGQAHKREAGAALPKVEDMEARAPGVELEGELQELLEKLQDCVEDFAVANNLDAHCKSMLTALPPKVALRTMGLLGKGNSFLMRGVRQPGAAVASRSRIAAEEEASGRAGTLPPFDEWPKLQEAFAEVNALPEDTKQLLATLTREQVLRVMGFTSGLRFVIPLEVAEPEQEVASRIAAAQAGESMLPVVSRSSGRPAMLSRGSPALLIPLVRAPQADVGGLSLGRGSSPQRRQRSRSARRYSHESWGKTGGKGGGGKGSHKAPPMAAPTFEPGEDSAPFWQDNRETFTQLNNLSDRCIEALMESEKRVCLQVMGLAGRENSFVIRGVRNPSAAVMSRLQKAHEGCYTTEPYARLPGLVEDFIAMNSFDERGQEVMRTLRPEVAVHVMGFTAENAFIIEGVRNPSAALMARVAFAQRVFPPPPR